VTSATAPALSKAAEAGFKRSDIIWVGVDASGEGSVPCWFAYKNGRILVVSRKEPGPSEQTVPGIPGASEVTIVTRRKGRDTALDMYRATVKILEGDERDEAAVILVDRRRSRAGAPQETLDRWRGECVIAELVLKVPA
jgi:hypothetical protein